MEQMNFHKQKLYTLLIAGVALIALLLPWLSVDFLGASQTWNGLRGWGILSLFGVLAVGVMSFIGNRDENYSIEFRKYVLIGFGAIALGAILFLLRKNSAENGLFGDVIKTGIGLWICLAAALAGAALSYGLIKIDTKPVAPKSGM